MQNFKSLKTISAELQAKKLSSLELCRETLANIDALNNEIGAYSDILVDTAEAEANASDERRSQGIAKGTLDGIPVAVKDLIDTNPAVCKAGLDHLSAYRPVHDAAVVQSLRDAGAVIVGVTETDSGAFGTSTLQVKNPLDKTRIAGGSSGGSAAAVAAGLAFAALGTDTGGSIRIPATCCSIAGFKPTWDRINLTGIRPLASILDHVGPLARSITDLQILQSVLDPEIIDELNNDLNDPLSLGLVEDYFADADQLIKAAMASVVETLRDAGASIRDRQLPHPDNVIPVHMINAAKEAAGYHTRHFPNDWKDYPGIARTTIELGLNYTGNEYQHAQRQRAEITAAVENAFDRVDVIILPTLPMDIPLRDMESVRVGNIEMPVLMATIRYTALFNQTGHPVVSMPAYILPDGRAVSIQLVGPKNSDGRLLKIAKRIEHILAANMDYGSFITGYQK